MLNEKQTLDYEVTPQTMAIIAVINENGTVNTRLMEESTEYIVHVSPIKMIEYACRYFGSSFQGRLDGTRKVSGITHKAPITINPAGGMYFFPTTSPMNRNCSWISHSHVKDIVETRSHQSKILFKNGQVMNVNASYGSMMNQIYRTSHFRFVLNERLNGLGSFDGFRSVDGLRN